MKKISGILLMTWLALSLSALDNQTWKRSTRGELPQWSTPVGYTNSGGSLYLARVIKSGVASIGYFDPAAGKAMVPDGGRTIMVQEFEVWAGGGAWVDADLNALPPTAFSAGTGADGRPVAIVRVWYKGWLVPATYSSQDKAAIADIGGKRLSFGTCEVLVNDWVPFSPSLDFRTVFYGNLANKDAAQYSVRAAYGKGGLHLGKYNASSKHGYIPYGGKEVSVDKMRFELFSGRGIWLPLDRGAVPMGAIPGGMDDDGSPLFIIRGFDASGNEALGKLNGATGKGYVSWGGKEMDSTNFSVLCYDLTARHPDSQLIQSKSADTDWIQADSEDAPNRAFLAGTDSDGSELAIIRSAQGNSLQPGKWRLAESKGYITANGQEVELRADAAQLYTGNGIWLNPGRSGVPVGAIVGGFESDGSQLYIIRSKYSGADVIGKYNPKTNEALIPYGGKAVRVNQFEILCSPNTSQATATAAPQATAEPEPVPGNDMSGDTGESPAAAKAEVNRLIEGTASVWGKGLIFPNRVELMKHRGARAGLVKITPNLGYWSGKGILGDKSQENFIYLNAFSLEGKTDDPLYIEVYGDKATPGISVLSPSGLWLNLRPRTGHGEFPVGGRSEMSAVLPEAGKYTVVAWNSGDEGVKSDYSLLVATAGQDFPGAFTDKTPRGTDKLPFFNIPVTPMAGAFYAFSVTTETFDPTLVLIDTASLKPLAADKYQVSLRGKTASISYYSDNGQPVLIQVKPARPGLAKGNFVVNARFLGIGK